MDLCDAFPLPLIFLVDCPGFIIGKEWERRSMLKWVARALHAHRRLSVPKLTVILRKAYGLAYWILGGKAMNSDAIVAWPTTSMTCLPRSMPHKGLPKNSCLMTSLIPGRLGLGCVRP